MAIVYAQTMLIAVNTQSLIKGRLEGLGWFTHEVLCRMVNNHPEHRFLFIFDRQWDNSFVFAPNVTPIRTFIPSRHPVLWLIRFNYIIPHLLKKYGADMFLSTDGYISLQPQIPTYNIIHDIGFVHYPNIQPPLINRYYNHFFPKFARSAHRLGTVSEYSKNDISKTWNISPEKIDVIYNGCKSMFRPMSQVEQEKVRSKITNGAPYFVYVGSINPRKNIEGMLRAFDSFKSTTNLPHKLVIVGERMFSGDSSVAQTLNQMQYKSDVILLGRMEANELQQVTASARGLVLVSFLEGFGVPLLEAMNCNVPVICSNVTSLPEVVGDAGLLVSPHSTDEIAEAFKQLATDNNLHQSLVDAAQLQRQKFSWEQSATDLWNGMMKIV